MLGDWHFHQYGALPSALLAFHTILANPPDPKVNYQKMKRIVAAAGVGAVVTYAITFEWKYTRLIKALVKDLKKLAHARQKLDQSPLGRRIYNNTLDVLGDSNAHYDYQHPDAALEANMLADSKKLVIKINKWIKENNN